MIGKAAGNTCMGRGGAWRVGNFLVPGMILIAGMVLTLVVWQVVRQHESSKSRVEFELLLHHITDAIQDRLKANEQVLRGAVGLFSANTQVGRDVTRAEFKAFVAALRLNERYPGIQGVGFSRLITPAQLADHLLAIRADGFPEYALRPPGERRHYSSIVYLEPFDWRNQRAFGYDMYSEPVRQRAMERAWKSGAAALSGRVILLQETDKDVQPGILMYLPVYQSGTTPTGEERRLDELIGWAYSPLRMKDMMSSLLERDIPHTVGRIAFTIYDGENADPAALLFSNEDSDKVEPSRFHASRKIEIAGQPWFLTATALPGLGEPTSVANSMVILTAGLGISLLLAFLNMNQLRSSARLAVAVSQLQESESRFRHFFEKNKSVMFLIDPESGAIIDANQAAASYYGYPKPSLLGMLINEINTLPPEEVAQERQRALHEERNYFNFPHRLASGEIRDVEVYSTPVEAAGKPLLFSVIHDITERKQQERALREASLQLALAQSAAQAGFWNWDIVSGKPTWTPELFQLLGLDPATTEASFEAWQSVLHPDDLQEAVGRIGDAVRDHVPLVNEYRIVLPSGQTRWIYARGDTSYDAQGRPLYMSGLCIDITSRKQIESDLHDSEETFRTLAALAPVGIYLASPDGDCIYANRRWCEMAGMSPADALGKGWLAALHPEDREAVASNWQRMVASEGTWGHEYRFRTRAGRVTWVYGLASPQRDSAGQIVKYIGSNLDITERKHTEAELDQYRHHLEAMVEERTKELSAAKEAAEAASRAKSTFLANMSHELRTPMNAIMGMTELIMRRTTDARQMDQLGKLKHASTHLLSVINDVLDISRIEAEHLVLEQLSFKFGLVLENLMGMIGQKVAEKGLKLFFDLPPAVASLTLLGDPMRLGQIFLNLAGNAVKFTAQGAITVRVKLLEEHPGDVLLRCEVQDTGIGIAIEDQRRLFTAFEQADSSMTRKYGGTGLGLAISKRLVEMMGGSIGIESTVGQGSTFWFTVSLKKSSDADTLAPTIAEQSAEVQLKAHHAGARILLAEDEPINQEVARGLLTDVGLTVELAEDGGCAVAMSQRSHYDLILMDMLMPMMNGIEATRVIRTLPGYARTPILAMTANAFNEDRRVCLAAGMDDHLAKPIDPDVLYETLLQWLSKSRA